MPLDMTPLFISNHKDEMEISDVSPGVFRLVNPSSGGCYVVRAATPRLMTTEKLNHICDTADIFSKRGVHFTDDNDIEFFVNTLEDANLLIRFLEEELHLPVGGTGRCLKNIVHTQGWVHCNKAATDASGLVKALMDRLHRFYRTPTLPSETRISVACCPNMCGAAHASDISIVGVHTAPPKIDTSLMHNLEIPKIIASCPVGAIRRDGDSVTIVEEKCVACGACYSVCPGLPIANPETDGVAIFVGGKTDSRFSPPELSQLIIPFIPNEPPHWTKVVDIVEKIMVNYEQRGESEEHIGDWIKREGWEQFFATCQIPFDPRIVDGKSYETWRKG